MGAELDGSAGTGAAAGAGEATRVEPIAVGPVPVDIVAAVDGEGLGEGVGVRDGVGDDVGDDPVEDDGRAAADGRAVRAVVVPVVD
ncbi:MAG: hypothetical protein ABMB14_32965, partial [Myxococcota bacterium]